MTCGLCKNEMPDSSGMYSVRVDNGMVVYSIGEKICHKCQTEIEIGLVNTLEQTVKELR